MSLLQKIFAVVTLILMAGCATTGQIPRDYSGSDAGYLIVGLGAAPGTNYTSYTLKFRKKSDPAEGSVRYLQENLFKPTPRDFDDSQENGFVDIQKLPAGEYEIYNFSIFLNGGMFQNYYGSRQDFSIPFKIVPDKATYIGDFTAVKITGKNFFGMTVPGGAYFILSNKQSRDVSIAKRKLPELGNIEPSVPDAAAVGNPFVQPKAL